MMPPKRARQYPRRPPRLKWISSALHPLYFVTFKHIDWGDVTENLLAGNGPIFSGKHNLDLTADQVVFKVNILVGPIGH